MRLLSLLQKVVVFDFKSHPPAALHPSLPRPPCVLSLFTCSVFQRLNVKRLKVDEVEYEEIVPKMRNHCYLEVVKIMLQY